MEIEEKIEIPVTKDKRIRRVVIDIVCFFVLLVFYRLCCLLAFILSEQTDSADSNE